MPSPPAGRPMKRVMTLNQKQIRSPAGEDTFSLAPDEAGTVTGGRTYHLGSSAKNKDTIRFHPVGTEAPSPRFSVHAGAPVLHILKAAVSPVIAKPVQGNHVKFSYAGDGTARSTPSVASTRTVRRSGEHRSGSTVRRVRALLRQGRIGKGLCCKPKKSPARQKRFSAPCPFCGEEQGHSIEAGRELYIQSMEAE